jgi:glycine hydroxymethyltransferase
MALDIQKVSGPKLVDWKKTLASEDIFKTQLESLRNDVETFASQFVMPGYDNY